MLCHAFTMAHFEFHSGQKLPTIRHHFAFLLPLTTFPSLYPVNSVNPVQNKKPPVTHHSQQAASIPSNSLNFKNYCLIPRTHTNRFFESLSRNQNVGLGIRLASGAVAPERLSSNHLQVSGCQPF
jgi:hypothetical protein